VEVYAFTPKGRVLELPRGATPVDFAYSVHNRSRHQCVGAKVNGQMGFAAARSRQRRRGGNSHAERPQAQPRLAELRQILAREKQDSAPSSIPRSAEEATEMGKRLLENESRNFRPPAA